MKNRKWLFGVGVAILVAVVLAGIGIVVMNQGRAEGHPDRGLPIVELDLNGVSWEDFKAGDKETKYAGNTVVLSAADREQRWEDVELKGRGNATWVREKKPLQLRFAERVNFLDLGRNRKWVFLTNYADSAQIRNATAARVAEMVGNRFAPRGEFVELYVDGEYEGLFYVTRKTEVGKGSVDLRDPGGVLVELDNVYGAMETCYFTGAGNCLVLSDVVEKTQDETAMADFLKNFDELEIAVEAGDYARFAELADVRSFAEYFVLSEFVVDVDAYWTSQYFYKDGPEDKIHAGPGWDFDMAFGNKNWAGGFAPTVDIPRHEEILDWPRYNEETDEWEEWRQYGSISKIFFQLMEMPEFQAEVRTVWQERMAGRKAELLLEMRRMVEKIYPAVMADAEKWERDDFGVGVQELLDWVQVRYDFMEEKYGNGTESVQNVI